MSSFKIVVVSSLLVSSAALSDPSNHHNSNVDVANEIATGSVNYSSRAWGLGGSDVDINDGYRSYSYVFGLVQDTKVNPVAVARDLMREGNYEAAAQLRCTARGVWKAFGSKDACYAALSVPPAGVAEEGIHRDLDEEHEEQQYQIAVLQSQLSEMQMLLERAPAAPTVRVERLTAEQRQALREVKE